MAKTKVKKIDKVKLSATTIKDIQQKIMLGKRVSNFIAVCEITNSTYYAAVNGSKIKEDCAERIIETLKKY